MTGAVEAVRGGVVAALRADATLVAELNGVFDGAPVRASAPYAEVGEVAVRDWSTKDRDGRELRVSVAVRDAGERSARLTRLVAAVERAVPAMPRDLPGWQVVTARFQRSRQASDGAGRWVAAVEFQVRVLAAE